MARSRAVYQFRIELLGIEPPIWRRIEVSSEHSFWDLHVAIQDAMGWQDSHLHHFRLIGSERVIGIPDDDGDDTMNTQAGWDHPIAEYFNRLNPLAIYEYDFGDSWVHEIRLEGVRPMARGMKYPRCIGGGRRCPPEDCGGAHGYERLLRVLRTPSDPDHADSLTWAGGVIDPEEFDPAAVRFHDPRERWRIAFAEEQN